MPDEETSKKPENDQEYIAKMKAKYKSLYSQYLMEDWLEDDQPDSNNSDQLKIKTNNE